MCSVVPRATPLVPPRGEAVLEYFSTAVNSTVVEVWPELSEAGDHWAGPPANAVAVKRHFRRALRGGGFGTAVTFDVVDKNATTPAASFARGWSA